MYQKGRGSEAEREMWSRGRERKKGREKDGWVKKVNRQVEDGKDSSDCLLPSFDALLQP